MHVVIVGCGRVGSELAARLSTDGHSVAVIDKNPGAFRRLSSDTVVETIEGLGFDRDCLERARIKDADAFAAVTNGDNSNILSARIARETFEVPRVVARIYDPRRAVIYQRLGIPTVATVAWTTDQVLRRLLPELTMTDWTHPDGSVSLVERDLPPAWAGRSLDSIDVGDRIRLVALTRAGTGRIVDHAMVGQESDVLHILVHRDAAQELEATLARPEEH
jgi:trk system potassium uptake protein TrkA